MWQRLLPSHTSSVFKTLNLACSCMQEPQGRMMKMLNQCGLLLLSTLFLILTVRASGLSFSEENVVKSNVYYSQVFELGPGEVANKFYANIDFPKGHIGIKDFKAEMVDETRNSVPLHEGYLHHWLTNRYYALVDENGNRRNRIIPLSNGGNCETSNVQFFGIGSETRKTDYYVPDPYGIEVGNPADIPRGYEERWYFNIHAIDTRGVVDKMKCAECRCDLYNTTTDAYGNPLPDGYIGGNLCCHDKAQCRLKTGFQGVKRNYYLKYTVQWVDWDDSVVPAKVYIFDVTDTGERRQQTESDLVKQYTENTCSPQYGCKIEYDVEPCDASVMSLKECVGHKRASVVMPTTGHIVFGVYHQHSGAIGGTVHREDGQLICSSTPIYGQGNEAGDEAGYVVGMTNCHPVLGSARVTAGEKLIMDSKYNNSQLHTGVMGNFYFLLAEDIPSNDM